MFRTVKYHQCIGIIIFKITVKIIQLLNLNIHTYIIALLNCLIIIIHCNLVWYIQIFCYLNYHILSTYYTNYCQMFSLLYYVDLVELYISNLLMTNLTSQWLIYIKYGVL
jgi:hypothetical protein